MQALPKKPSFSAYLAKQKSPDSCYLTGEFLKGTRIKHRLSEFVNGKNQFTQEPAGLIFSEKSGMIYDGKKKPIKNW